jgi:hypothetical protein
MMRSSHRRNGLEVILEVSLLWSASGCSYAFVHGPSALPQVEASDPQGGERARTSCTTSNALPVLDTVVAVPLIGAGVLMIVAGASEGSCSGSSFGCVKLSSGEAIALGAVATGLGALALASAVTGYGRTADCRRAEEALPSGPHPSAQFLLDVDGIAAARARSE